jgi:hypothetical protein
VVALGRGKRTVRCACGYKFCFRCKEEAHFPSTCDQATNWKQRDKGSASLDVKYIMEQTKPCPHCVCEGTMVSLANGTSVPIEELKDNTIPVLTYDSEQGGICSAQQTAWYPQGEKPCVQLTFSDGRTLTCTDDHLIHTLNRGDVKAGELELNDDQIICGGDQPQVKPPSLYEYGLEQGWQLRSGGMVFEAGTPAALERSKKFCRILGMVLTDGRISVRDQEVKVSFGHQLDVNSFVRDCKDLVPGVKISVYFSDTHNVWCVCLPLQLRNAIIGLNGIVIGTRIDQHHHWPNFVMEEDFPQALLCEFIGGCFGGDGLTLKLVSNKKKGSKKYARALGFCASANVGTIDSLKDRLNQMKSWLRRFDVESELHNPQEHPASKEQKLQGDAKKMAIVLSVSDTSILSFATNIGFRYCCHKQAGLAAGGTWRRLQQTVKVHNDKAVYKGYEITGTKWFTEIGALGLFTTTKDDANNKGNGDIEHRDEEFKLLEEESEGSQADRPNKKTYAVPREKMVLPTYLLTVVDRCDVGAKRVYDISVPATELFIANGIVIHNCGVRTNKNGGCMYMNCAQCKKAWLVVTATFDCCNANGSFS